MSSEQYSEKPWPPKEKVCRVCGEVSSAKSELCWLCLEEFVIANQGLRNEITPSAAIQAETLERQRRKWQKSTAGDDEGSAQNGALQAFLAITVVAVCIIIGFEAPGFLILLLAIAAPGLFLMVLSRRSAGSGDNGSDSGLTAVFIRAGGGVALAGVVGVAAFIAFFATCVSHFASENWR